MYSVRRKRASGSVMELNAILKKIKMVKEKPVAKWNKGSADLRAEDSSS